MNVWIHKIETVVPEHTYERNLARDLMCKWADDARICKILRLLHNRSHIDKRHSVLPDFLEGHQPLLFKLGKNGKLREPTTGERNRVFIQKAKGLALAAARAAANGTVQDITHVITVSCTGFSNPGIDYEILRGLGLPDGVERYHLGFMGCYAAFPALRMAAQFCRANPNATVLVVCVELCTLHLQIKGDPDTMLANTLFADGVAAALISSRPPAPDAPSIELGAFQSSLAPEGKSDMAWEIGDTGFDIRLSSYVPDIISMNVEKIVDSLLLQAGLGRRDIGWWAVHPGGKAILDTVEDGLSLNPSSLEISRSILREFGNMSSATILFVLRRMMERAQPTQESRLFAMAFGPGLTIESAVMRLCGSFSEGRRSRHVNNASTTLSH